MAKKSRKSKPSSASAGPTLLKVNSIAHYIETVQAIATREDQALWMRGHSKASYRLVPSVLRNTVPYMSARGYLLKGDEFLTSEGGAETGISPERMLDDFKRRAVPFLDSIPRNDFEWLFLMQHHGVPTRLLDWTTNALVALFFAVDEVRPDMRADESNGGDSEKNSDLDEFDVHSSAIYIINPTKVNGELRVGLAEPIDVAADYDRWQNYARPMQSSSPLDVYAPICILAPQITPRIRAQAGLFSLHGTNLHPLDYYTIVRPLLTKILIPHAAASRMRSELHLLGITPSFIYPGLDGVAKDVLEDAQRHFAVERRKHVARLERQS